MQILRTIFSLALCLLVVACADKPVNYLEVSDMQAEGCFCLSDAVVVYDSADGKTVARIASPNKPLH